MPERSTTCAPAGVCVDDGSAHRGDASVADDERLILERRGAGAIDHARVREHDGGRVDGDVLADVLRREWGVGRRGATSRARMQ